MYCLFRPYSAALLIALLQFLCIPPAICQLVNQGLEPQAKSDTPWSVKAAMKISESNPDYREDFAALPVSANNLKLEIAVLGEKDDDANKPFIRERWHLVWRPGDPIDVYIVRPRSVEKAPVVVYLYSYPQDTDRFKLDSWCSYAVGDGFAAVGFVSALTGHRLEYRSPKDDFFNRLPESLGASVHDVQMILNFLATRSGLDMNRVGMFGQGSGGGIAILASGVDPRIKSLDVLTPWGDWPHFVVESTFVPSEDRLQINNPQFLASVGGLDPLLWLPKVKAQNVRVQNVRGDRHMPDGSQERMEAAAPILAEIDQYGDSAALVPQAANGKLLDWIKSSLQSDSKPERAVQKSQRVHVYPARAQKDVLGEIPAAASSSTSTQVKQ